MLIEPVGWSDIEHGGPEGLEGVRGGRGVSRHGRDGHDIGEIEAPGGGRGKRPR